MEINSVFLLFLRVSLEDIHCLHNSFWPQTLEMRVFSSGWRTRSLASFVFVYRSDLLKASVVLKHWKLFFWSFTGFCYRNRWLDLCLSEMRMWFHLLTFLYLFSFFSALFIIIVQINRLKSKRFYVSFESMLTASHTHKYTFILVRYRSVR